MIETAAAVVGRDRELDVLRAFVASPEGALVLTGEAGIGKTILFETALAEAAASGLQVLRADPAASETEISFAALADLLADVDGALDALPPPQARALAVALRRAEPDDVGSPLDRGAVAFAFVGVLRALAAAGPVLVAVDDVQWLDRESASALSFGTRRLGGDGVAWLLAGRANEDAALPLGLERASDRDRVEILRVGALSLGALHRILHGRLGASFSRPMLRRLHEISGGNPFFALELGRALQDQSDVAWQEPPVPRRLHELLRERLAGLPRGALEAVQVAAALSRPTVSVLERLADPAAIAAAVDADVLDVSDGRVAFTHPLVAAAAYAMLGPIRSREIHARLAAVVDDPEERARHLARSTDDADAAVAAAIDLAAERARCRGGLAGAAELFEHAHRLTPPDHGEDLLRRRSNAAASYFDAGDAAKARTLFEEVVAAAPAGEVRAEALTRLGRVCGYGADLRMAADLYRRAIGEAAEGAVTRGEAEAGLALAMMRMLEDLPTAARHAQAASALAQRQGDVWRSAEYLAAQAVIETILAEPSASDVMAQALAAQAASAPKTTAAGQTLLSLWGGVFGHGVVLALTEDLPGARRVLSALRTEALDAGHESSLPLILRYLSSIELALGDWAAAEAYADEGFEIAVQTGQLSQEAVLAGSRAVVAAHVGDVDAARSAAQRASELASSTGSGLAQVLVLSALGCLELSLRDPDEVVRVLHPAVDELEAAGVREPTVTAFVPDLVEALIDLDRSDEALRLLGPYEERAITLDRASALAAAARCRGLSCVRLGDAAGAASQFERALAEHDRLELPFERARTLLARGTAQRRVNQRRDARDSLGEALAVFDRLGARLWVDRARAELTRIGGRTPAGSTLTPAEQRIAALVAEGKTNKEVAAILVVADRTVESALTQIYRKLDVRSRTELARKLAVSG